MRQLVIKTPQARMYVQTHSKLNAEKGHTVDSVLVSVSEVQLLGNTPPWGSPTPVHFAG